MKRFIAWGVVVSGATMAAVSACRWSTWARSTENVAASVAPATFPAALLAPPSALGKAFFRENTLGVDETTFDERWSAAREDPLLFFRSFVRPYWAYVKPLTASWPIGPCLGDAHPDNFGFVEFFPSEAGFAYNDLDDSGLCPVALDALRYFTALGLITGKETVARTVATYVEVLVGEREPVKVDADIVPKFEKVRRGILKENVQGTRFVDSAELRPVDEALRHEIAAAVVRATASLAIGEHEVFDVREALGLGGGSRGLGRYWVLAAPRGEGAASPAADIFEIKQTVEPGVEVGGWGGMGADRLVLLKRFLWTPERQARVYEGISIRGTSFLMRSRVKKSVKREALSEKEAERLFQAQVSLMAKAHRPTLGRFGLSQKEYARWLEEGAAHLGKTFRLAFDAHR